MRALKEVNRPWLSNFDRYFDRLLHDRLPALFAEDDETASALQWAPAVDIKDEAEQLVVRADLPGVDPKDVEVTLDNGILTIRGERKDEKQEEREGFRRAERFHGTFFRRFVLGDAVDAEAVSARSDKGVLEIVIPKSKQAQTRRIEVQS